MAGRTRRFDCKLESSSSSKQEVGRLSFGKIIIWEDYHLGRLSFGKIIIWKDYHLGRLSFGKPHHLRKMYFSQVFLAKPHDGKKDFELNRKINNFVSKYYKA